MPSSRADGVRRLFSTDTATKNAMGGVPYSKDIIAEIDNTERYNEGSLPFRPRIRLCTTMHDASGLVIGYTGVSIVRGATPTAHEQRYVWGGTFRGPVSGVFVRRLIVLLGERNRGYGALLLDNSKRMADELGLHLYCDTKADNAGMRRFLHRESGAPNMFWYTHQQTLMVRYMWI